VAENDALEMHQWAPYPELLDNLVKRLCYKDGWEFSLTDVERDQDHGRGTAGGLTLAITIHTEDSYWRGRKRSVVHYFIVPAATYDWRSWQRWLFERCLDVERHEGMEFFRLRSWDQDGSEVYERPYAPSHGPGNDPYMVREIGTEIDQRTSFRGEVK
jgi:hypothetical protein